MDQIDSENVSINTSRTAWPSLILMLVLSFLDNLLFDNIIFQKDGDDFEIEHILGRRQG